MYRIIIEQKTSKEIEALPDNVIQSVYDAIKALRVNPRPYNVKKLISRDGWRIKIGNYRVLYTIDDKAKLVTVYRVKHRKDAYR